MHDERTDRQVLAEGSQAAAILESPAYARAVAASRQRLFEEFAGSQESGQWSAIWARLKALDDIDGELRASLVDAKALEAERKGR